MCGFETIVNTAPDLFTEAEIDAYIQGIFNGTIHLRNLSVANYQKVAERLMSGVYKGYGKHINDVLYLSPDYNMLHALKQNVHIFSGAKEYQQVRQMSGLLSDGDKIKSFSEFKKQVMPVFETYNKNYLNAEYNSAILQSRSASQWQTITEQQGLFPLLQYQTVEDGRVRPEHAALSGVIKPVNDPFWDKYMPQNGWNCRCDVTQLDEGKITDTSKLVVENVPPLFQFNPGKEKIIFSKEHPYFDVAKKDKDFAKQNFNLPLPKNDIKVNVPKTEHKFIPDKIKELSIKLDERVYDLLNKKLDVQETKSGAYASGTGKYIRIGFNEERYKKSVVYQTKIFYHEMGHVIHYDKNIIQFGKHVSDDYSKHFGELKKLVKGKELEIADKLKEYSKGVWNIDFKDKTDLLLKRLDLKTVTDLHEHTLSVHDVLQSLTNSRHGFGHTKSYMNIKGAKEAEMFAHSMENFFQGNPVFKEVMPEVYEKSKLFIKSLLK